MTPDPTRQPIYAAPEEDRLESAKRRIRDSYAFMLENLPPVWGDDPTMVIDQAMNLLAKLRGGRTSQGDPLTRAERIYAARGLARAFAALKELEQTAERAEDGALVFHVDDQLHPWTKARPHRVEDISPFAPGPQAVWRSLAGQDPDADQMDSPPAARTAGSSAKSAPSDATGGQRSAPKLAHTITFHKPDGLDVTTDKGKLGVLALVVRAMYPAMDNLLLEWVVLHLGTTLPDGTPRFNDDKWLTDFAQKKVGEEISITADEKFTIELDLLLLQAPDRISLIGAEVYRGSAGMYYIVGAEFGAFLVAITGGAGLGLLASEGGAVAMTGAELGIEGLGAESFGGFVSQGLTSWTVSAQAFYAQAAPYLTVSMLTPIAYSGTQAISEGRFGEWASENANDLAEQYFAMQPSGLFHTPAGAETNEASALATTEETATALPAVTEETTVPLPAASTDHPAGKRVAAAEDKVRRVEAEIETRQQAGKGPTKAQQSRLEGARNKLAAAETKQAAAIETAQNRVDAAKQLAETRAAAYEEANAARPVTSRTVRAQMEKIWNTDRPEAWKTKAQAEIDAREAGTSTAPRTQAEYDAQLEAEAANARSPLDENQRIDWPGKNQGGSRLPPGAVQELNPIKGMSNADLAEVAQTGQMPLGWKRAAELEHRIPQRVGNWLAEAGVPPEEAASLTKRTDPSNLEPASKTWHETVDEYRARFRKGHDVQDPMSSLDTRVERPLGDATDQELADIVAAVKKYGANLDLPVRLGARKVSLRDVLGEEMARRKAFKGQML